MERAIVHLNIADFAVAVERTLDSRLRGRPVIIAPAGEARATVYDMSEEAYGAGVRKGQPLPRALRACRDAELLTPHPERYEHAMRAFLNCILPYSPRIEATGVQGHVFVDTTGTERLFGTAMDIAWRIRKTARAELNLNPIWTVAPNKLVAKVASRMVKPVGECLVEAGDEAAFLAPLPVHLLPGLEAEDLARLREYRLGTIGDAARWTLPQLALLFGTRARHLSEAFRGLDASPVLHVGEQPPTVAGDHAFGEDTNDVAQVLAALQLLAEHAGHALREQGQMTQRVGVVLDYSDGVRVVRQAAPPNPTSNDFTLFDHARRALDLAWTRRVRLRHLRVLCDRLCFPPAQLDLFGESTPDETRRAGLVAAMDRIRGRFGSDAIHLGRSLAALT